MSAPHSIVSGGTGLVGRFIVESLLDAGHAVTVLGRTPPLEGFFQAPVGFRPLSLEPDAAKSTDFAGADFLVHAAFDHVAGRYRGGEGDDPERFRRLNHDGTITLFHAAKAAGIKRTVFLSSRAVYGRRPPGTALDEAMTPAPDTLYGEVKRSAEKDLALMSGRDMAGVSLRATGVYGPAGPCREHKWAGMFRDYLAGRSIEPRAGTEVHGRDVGAAVRLMLEADAAGIARRVFNVSDILIDRRDILDVVQRVTGCPHALPEPADKGGVNAMNTEALRGLGWRPGGTALFERTVESLARSGAVI